jgi:hypothetical protein
MGERITFRSASNDASALLLRETVTTGQMTTTAKIPTRRKLKVILATSVLVVACTADESTVGIFRRRVAVIMFFSPVRSIGSGDALSGVASEVMLFPFLVINGDRWFVR